MLFKDNTIIFGDMDYGLKLMEGVVAFDLMVLDAPMIIRKDGSMLPTIYNLLRPDGTILVKQSKDMYESPNAHILSLHGFMEIGKFDEDNNEQWTVFKKTTFQRLMLKPILKTRTIQEYLKSAMSVLCMGEKAQNVSKKMFELGFSDSINRMFVFNLEQEKNDIFSEVLKQSYIYNKQIDQIILEEPHREIA